MMNKSDKEFFERQRFSELKKRLFTQEKEIKKERHQLWLKEKELDKEETVWDRLELFSNDILGYVSQIASKGYTIQSPDEVIRHLHKLNIFETECVIGWYYSDADNYPQIKQYFELLDYVRLLTLEYIEQFVLLKAS
jgi:hypothetical protein